MEAFIPALVGLIGVIVGSLLSPWLAQRFETQRAKAQARRRLIDEAREYVAGKQFSVANFSRKPFFLSIQDELSSVLVAEVESFRNTAQEDARERIRKDVLSELARIERKWELI